MSISTDRFGTYLAARAGDQDRALALYEWNADICAAFYVPLQTIEVALRNAFHRELRSVYGATWTLDPGFRAKHSRLAVTIAETERQLRHQRIAVDTPHVIAALAFGFWTTMLQPRYQNTLWAHALNRAFPEFFVLHHRKITRPEAAAQFDEVRQFRNRVFHHEPLFRRALQDDYAAIRVAASWICPELLAWLERRSTRCTSMIAKGPPA